MMDKIKPYLFWIICGVLLLIEIILVFVMVPENKNKEDVYKAKRSLDSTVEQFKPFVEKARNKPPTNVEIDNVTYFNEMQSKYLVSESWLPGLQSVERDLQTHKKNVVEALEKRSEILHQVISQTDLLGTWYNEYEGLTSHLLDELYKADQLVLPSNDPFRAAETKDDRDEILRTNASLRKIGGFYTKGTGFPTANEHPIITTRYRISEAIVKALLKAKGSLLDNQAVNFQGVNFVEVPSAAVQPKLVEIVWGTTGARWETENRVAIKNGSAIGCKVKLRGSVSALLAATAEIEMEQNPIFIVRGSNWTQPRKGSNEAEKKVDTPIEMTLHLAVLDYQGGK